MKKYQIFLSDNFQFLEVKYSIYLNRRVFVMVLCDCASSFDIFYTGLNVHIYSYTSIRVSKHHENTPI